MEESWVFGIVNALDVDGLRRPRLASPSEPGLAGVSTYQVAKRFLDVSICLLLLPLAAVILAACAIAIKLDSRGPILFLDERSGLGGRRFRIYKLRTMSDDSAVRPICGCPVDPEIALDPRITPIGQVLRRTGLDDLPQLLNVLRGEMSLVGPRPRRFSVYAERLWRTALLKVKPGITSVARVSAADGFDTDQRLRLDIGYVRNRCIGVDLGILLQTLGIALDRSRFAVKRAFDVSISLPLILLLGPVMVLVALAVRLGSPGPVIFRQVRVGRDGRPFEILKFRTMRADAEAQLAADPVLYARYVSSDYKLPAKQDPRVTPIGRWLRRTSLDELPQLFNVLRGEMSLVGPRPLVPEELEHYRGRVAKLLSAPPGVTGAWQVCGRSSLHYPARCEVELEYVRTWSLAHDLVILLGTVRVVLSGRGAH